MLIKYYKLKRKIKQSQKWDTSYHLEKDERKMNEKKLDIFLVFSFGYQENWTFQGFSSGTLKTIRINE